MTLPDNTSTQPYAPPDVPPVPSPALTPPAAGTDAYTGSVLLLAVDVHHDGTTTELRLSGELDVATADELRHHIRMAVNAHNPHRLLLEMSGLGFADSSGLSVLVWAHQLMSERGHQLRLHHPQPQVMRVLHITGLHTRLHITEASASGGSRSPGSDRRPARRRSAPR
ncbi:STAS domain-containing protein [Actinomadura macra]|uniref:STAS domain-containing protein n=1 Tax=Actinomadura macra TaxID=46164 RepID=UPI000AE3CDA9|nr:STAS domain-containing protein [Actinomadura macra]